MSYFRWGVVSSAVAVIISIGLGVISGVSLFHIMARAVIFAVVFFGGGFGLRFLINSVFPEFFTFSDEVESDYAPEKTYSGVSVTYDTIGEYAVPELYKSPGDSDELGNIEDLIAGIVEFRRGTDIDDSIQEGASRGGVDRNGEDGYNDRNVQDARENGFRTARAPEQEVINFGDMFGDTGELDWPGVSPEKADRSGVEKQQVPQSQFAPSFMDESVDSDGLVDLDSMATSFGVTASPAGFGGEAGSAEYARGETRSGYVGNKPQPMKGDYNPKELAEGIRTALSKDK